MQPLVGREHPVARPTVVVVPGLCVAAYLQPACSALAARGIRTILLRPPGWPGAGHLRTDPLRLRDLALPLADVLAAEDVRDAVLLGQSVGAQLAAHVATAAPERVSLLVLQGPTFDPRWRTLPQAAIRLALDFARERPRLLATEVPEWLRAGLPTVHRVARLALADRLEETVRSYRGDVAVLVGEHDTLSTRAWTRSLASTNDLHRVLPGLPHSSPHADPESFVAAFLALLDGGTRA